MKTVQVHELEVATEIKCVGEYLECLLHSIFFHRALGPMEMQDYEETSKINISYVRCNNKFIEEEIKRIISELKSTTKRTGCVDYKIELLFSFREGPPRSWLSSFIWSEEEKTWEQFNIHLHIKESRSTNSDDVAQQLRQQCLDLVAMLSQPACTLPPLADVSSPISYPFVLRLEQA